MTYKLAKQLKDAGFPQNFVIGCWLYPNSVVAYQWTDAEHLKIKDTYVYIPTLSELIAACKGTIIKLWILKDGQAGVQLEDESLDDVIYYKTPEEAVARLWLSLNQKND